MMIESMITLIMLFFGGFIAMCVLLYAWQELDCFQFLIGAFVVMIASIVAMTKVTYKQDCEPVPIQETQQYQMETI